MVGSWWKLSSWIADSYLLTVYLHGRDREQERERKPSGASSYKGINPIKRAPTSWPHLNLITSHLQKPSHWGFKIWIWGIQLNPQWYVFSYPLVCGLAMWLDLVNKMRWRWQCVPVPRPGLKNPWHASTCPLSWAWEEQAMARPFLQGGQKYMEYCQQSQPILQQPATSSRPT